MSDPVGRGLTNQTWPHAVSHAEFKGPHLLWKGIFKLPLQLNSWRCGIQGVSAHSTFNSEQQSCTTWYQTCGCTWIYTDICRLSNAHSEVLSQRSDTNTMSSFFPLLGGFNLSASAMFTHIKLQKRRSNTLVWHTKLCRPILWCWATLCRQGHKLGCINVHSIIIIIIIQENQNRREVEDFS